MAFAPTADRLSRPTASSIRRVSAAHTLGAGLVAGQTSGLVMAVVMMALSSVALGQNPFRPLQIIGAFARGDAALEGVAPLAIVSGLAISQLGPALVWGLVFGVLVAIIHPRRAYGLLLLGLAVGVLAQVVDVYFLVPRLAAELHVPNYWAAQVHPAISWLGHIAFGLCLSVYPWKYDPVGRSFA